MSNVTHNAGGAGCLPNFLIIGVAKATQRFWQAWPAALRRPLFRGLDRLAPKPPPLDPALRRQLTNLFRTDILATQALIQQDLTHWLVDKDA